MRAKAIIFSVPMVQAILEGRKTQTRRIVKPSIVEHIEYMGSSNNDPPEFDYVGLRYAHWENERGKEMPAEWLIYCTEYPEDVVIPIGQGYGAVGDRLWVRETWALTGDNLVYRANGDGDDNVSQSWRSSLYMPRWASRINLEITGVRIERLQDISEADAIAEGARRFNDLPSIHPYGQDARWSMRTPTSTGKCLCSARSAFANLWESIKGIGSWNANPWVWVIEFKLVGAQLDA